MWGRCFHHSVFFFGCYYHYVQIYSAGVSVFLGDYRPSRTGDVHADISIDFSCDPEISSKLVISISVLFLAFAGSEVDVLILVHFATCLDWLISLWMKYDFFKKKARLKWLSSVHSLDYILDLTWLEFPALRILLQNMVSFELASIAGRSWICNRVQQLQKKGCFTAPFRLSIKNESPGGHVDLCCL